MVKFIIIWQTFKHLARSYKTSILQDNHFMQDNKKKHFQLKWRIWGYSLNYIAPDIQKSSFLKISCKLLSHNYWSFLKQKFPVGSRLKVANRSKLLTNIHSISKYSRWVYLISFSSFFFLKFGWSEISALLAQQPAIVIYLDLVFIRLADFIKDNRGSITQSSIDCGKIQFPLRISIKTLSTCDIE